MLTSNKQLAFSHEGRAVWNALAARRAREILPPVDSSAAVAAPELVPLLKGTRKRTARVRRVHKVRARMHTSMPHHTPCRPCTSPTYRTTPTCAVPSRRARWPGRRDAGRRGNAALAGHEGPADIKRRTCWARAQQHFAQLQFALVAVDKCFLGFCLVFVLISY